MERKSRRRDTKAGQHTHVLTEAKLRKTRKELTNRLLAQTTPSDLLFRE